MDLMVHRRAARSSTGAALLPLRRDDRRGDLRGPHRRRVPRRAARPCGVSLGGNQLLKYLGERGAAAWRGPARRVRPRRGRDLSCPTTWRAGRATSATGLSRIYERHFLRSLLRKVEQKMPSTRTSWTASGWPTCARSGSSTTCSPARCTASAARPTTTAGRARSTSSHGVRVPTLLLSAVDDPFLPASVLDEVRRDRRDESRA